MTYNNTGVIGPRMAISRSSLRRIISTELYIKALREQLPRAFRE